MNESPAAERNALRRSDHQRAERVADLAAPPPPAPAPGPAPSRGPPPGRMLPFLPPPPMLTAETATGGEKLHAAAVASSAPAPSFPVPSTQRHDSPASADAAATTSRLAAEGNSNNCKTKKASDPGLLLYGSISNREEGEREAVARSRVGGGVCSGRSRTGRSRGGAIRVG